MNQLVVRKKIRRILNKQKKNNKFFFSFYLVSEEQCLRDIEFDEKFGALRDDHHPASKEAKKKK